MFRRRIARSIRPEVDALEGRQLLTTVTEVEPNNTARTATIATFPASGPLDLKGASIGSPDKDFFRFTATRSGPMTIDLRRLAGSGVYLKIETSLGKQVYAANSANGSVTGKVNAVAGYNYVVRIVSTNKSAAFYNVDFNIGPSTTPIPTGTPATGTIPEVEPDNTISTGTLFALDSSNKATLTGTTTRSDPDYFVFTATKSGYLGIKVAATGGQAALAVQTLESVNIFTTNPKAGINSGSFPILAGNTYAIRIVGVGNATASYTVNLTLFGAS